MGNLIPSLMTIPVEQINEQDQVVEVETYRLLQQIGYEYARPTQSLAQRYLRKRFNLNIEIIGDKDVYDSFYYAISIIGGGYITSLFKVSNNYGSYEKALEAALLFAIGHIKKATGELIR
jgi:hypothetical protein